MSVARVVSFKGKEGGGDAVLGWLKPAVEHIIDAPGCEGMSLFRDPENPDTILSIEQWDIRESHHKFLAAMSEADMAKANSTMTGPPEGVFYDPV